MRARNDSKIVGATNIQNPDDALNWCFVFSRGLIQEVISCFNFDLGRNSINYKGLNPSLDEVFTPNLYTAQKLSNAYNMTYKEALRSREQYHCHIIRLSFYLFQTNLIEYQRGVLGF